MIRDITDEDLKWMIEQMTEQYYTPKELAEILKVTKETIYFHLQAGKIPHIKIGTQYRIPVSYLNNPEEK